MWFPHGNIAFSLLIFSWVPKRISRWPDMQLPHVFIAFFICDEAFPHVFIAFWHPQASFWEPIGLSWGLLFGMLEGPVELLGHPLGPKWSQKHQDEGHKSDLGSSGGGQGVSEALRVRFWDDFHHFVCAIWYFRLLFGEKGFVHAVWYLDLDSCCVFFHFSMAFQHGCSIALQFAVAFLNQFWTWSRQRRRRGRRPHDVHVRCLDLLCKVVYAVVMSLGMLEISVHVFSVMVRSALLNLTQ